MVPQMKIQKHRSVLNDEKMSHCLQKIQSILVSAGLAEKDLMIVDLDTNEPIQDPRFKAL